MASKPLNIVVVTKDLATGEIESRKVINYNNSDDRKWLGRHTFWAFHNTRSVLTHAEDWNTK